MKNILITGGAGFIGSQLCERLLEEGNHVVCLDNLYTGEKSNIAGLMSNPNFEFIIHDVTERISVPCDQIYHLACPASPPHYQSDPVYTSKTNFIGTLNMLELAKEQNATLLYASTSEIYGDPEFHPQAESYWGRVNPIGPRSCYDEGKRCAESLCMDYHRQFQLDVKIVRIFNTYGPNMSPKDGRVVSNFIIQALKNKDLTIYGNGEQTRSFQYIDDLLGGIMKMMKTRNFAGPLNLGNPEELSILDLAMTIIKLTDSNSKITFHKLPQDDPKQRCPDISLAAEILAWTPKVNLETGLKKTIDYFKNILAK